MNSEKIENIFTEISDFITESRKLLSSDALLELKGLDEKVTMLCENVMALSPDERVKYSAHLQKSFDELKELADALSKHRDNMSSGIKNIPNHKKASSAYLKVNATGKKEE